MISSFIVFLVIAICVMILLFFVSRRRLRYVYDLNEKLSNLLKNPVILPYSRYEISRISGTYHGYSVTFEWDNIKSSNPGRRIDLKIIIHDMSIPKLEVNPSDLANRQAGTEDLWHELSKMSSVKEIKFKDHALQVNMEWSDESELAIASPAWFPFDTSRLTQETGAVLENVLKITQQLS